MLEHDAYDAESIPSTRFPATRIDARKPTKCIGDKGPTERTGRRGRRGYSSKSLWR